MKFSQDKGYQAFRILQVVFIAAPIIAGLDKFFNFLINWSSYLARPIVEMTGGHSHAFLMVIGIIEIIAGIGVIFKPKIFSYVIAVWFLAIIINLLIKGHYFDIVLRDIGLMLAALSLGKLAEKYEGKKVV